MQRIALGRGGPFSEVITVPQTFFANFIHSALPNNYVLEELLVIYKENSNFDVRCPC